MITPRGKQAIPDYADECLKEFCSKAGLEAGSVHLVIQQRKRHGKYLARGSYELDFRTVTMKITPQVLRENFRFALAHEIGHLKQHREVGPMPTAETWAILTEQYADDFAMRVCNCYPVYS